jgi:hypothetical protein
MLVLMTSTIPAHRHAYDTTSSRSCRNASSWETVPWAPGYRTRTSSRRNTFGCNLVNEGDDDIPDKIRELSLNGTAIAKRVGVDRADEMGVQTSIN